MMRETELSELVCPSCSQLTEHEITYAGRLMVSVRCTVCGNEIHVGRGTLPNEYRDDLIDRIKSKPHRLGHRLRRHPWQVISSLPVAIVRQPVKFIGEFRTIRREKRRTDPPGQ